MTDRPGQALALARLRWWANIAETYPHATDGLDAGCQPDLELGPNVDPPDIIWLILFADVSWDDEAALRARAAEWRDLFDG